MDPLLAHIIPSTALVSTAVLIVAHEARTTTNCILSWLDLKETLLETASLGKLLVDLIRIALIYTLFLGLEYYRVDRLNETFVERARVYDFFLTRLCMGLYLVLKGIQCVYAVGVGTRGSSKKVDVTEKRKEVQLCGGLVAFSTVVQCICMAVSGLRGWFGKVAQEEKHNIA